MQGCPCAFGSRCTCSSPERCSRSPPARPARAPARSPRSSSPARSIRRPRRGSGRRSPTPTDDGAPLVVIRLDTPGGLESSMREIIRDIIAAPMPVVVYVSPDGARAASAGAFITEAADVAAMAPQTNIGSASAVTVDRARTSAAPSAGRSRTTPLPSSARSRRATGETARSPSGWSPRPTNFTAEEALEGGAIDLVAASEQELIGQLDGFEVAGPKSADADDRGAGGRGARDAARLRAAAAARQPDRRPTCCC